jgi:anti-sigma factor RsiW
MEFDYIKAHMVIERYVQGKLSDDEVVAFEERLLWDKELQEEVDLAETMQAWLKDSAEDSKFTAPELSQRPGWLPGLLTNPGFAAAASFALGLLAAFPLLQGPDQATGFLLEESAPSVVTPLPATRNASSEATIVPVTPGAVSVLLLDVPYPDQAYDVVIRTSASAETVWTQSGLVASYQDAVAVGLPGAAAPPGAYLLIVESVDGNAYRQQFTIRTVATD